MDPAVLLLAAAPLPGPGHYDTSSERVAKLSVAAWFCRGNCASVVTGFFHPVSVSPDIAGSIRCH